MPHWVVQKVTDALNNHDKSVKSSRILILGLSYKRNIDDTRESPAVEIMSLLHDKGANINYSDPHVPIFPSMRDYQFDLRSIPLNAQTLSSYDCVVLATDHDSFDYELIQAEARLIVDTRGRLKRAPHIIPA